MTERPEPAGPVRAEADPGARELVGVARGAAVNLFGGAFNQIVRFAVTLLLSRWLGGSAVGVYYQAFAFLTLLGLLSLGGFRGALTRFVAMHRADEDPSALRGTVRIGLLVPASISAALAAALYGAAPWLARTAFSDPALESPLRFVALALVPTVVTDAALAATQGYRTMKPYAAVGLLYEPAVRIVLTVALVQTGGGVRGAMIALLAANSSAAVLALATLRRLMGAPAGRPRHEWRPLLRFSAVSWVSTLSATALFWADTLLLGIFASSAQVGVYQVATRLTLLSLLIMGPMTTAFAPRITDLYRRGDNASLARTYTSVTSWSLRLSLPAFAVVVLFRHELLELFGEQFVAGATVVLILSVAELIDVGCGPAGYMIIMSGRPELAMTTNLLGLGLNVGLNLWLIPRYGIVGAAAAWAGANSFINLARLWLVRRELGMTPWGDYLVRSGLAVAAAAGAGWAAGMFADGIVAIVAGGAAVGAVYLVVLIALRLSPDDRIVLDELRVRWRGRSKTGG